MEKNLDTILAETVKSALELGATDAKIILAEAIPVEDEIVRMCQSPQCPCFGKSPYCPPRAMSPSRFREKLTAVSHAVVFKVDVSPEVLLSSDSARAFRIIYEIAAELEARLIKGDRVPAQGLAAGSCWSTLCQGEPCRVLAKGEPCKEPKLARPSMEAVGVNVFKLAAHVGWRIHKITNDSDPEQVQSGMLVGLVLVGRLE